MSRPVPALAILAVSYFGLPTGGLAQDGVDVEKLYRKVVRSSVFVAAPTKGGYETGSGVLVDADRLLVLTTLSVVKDAETAAIQFPIMRNGGVIVGDKATYLERVEDGTALPGTVVFRDARRGLALVRLKAIPGNPPALPLAEKSGFVGATAWSISSPGRVPQLFAITEGRIRTVGEVELPGPAPDAPLKVRAITATNVVNPGDAGSPLFDRKGELVGLTAAFSGPIRQVNTFVSAEEIHAFLKEARAHLDAPVPVPAPVPAAVAPIPEPPHVVYAECPPAPRRCCLLRLFVGCGQRRR